VCASRLSDARAGIGALPLASREELLTGGGGASESVLTRVRGRVSVCITAERRCRDARIALPREPRSVGGEVASMVGSRKLQGGGRRFQVVGETLH